MLQICQVPNIKSNFKKMLINFDATNKKITFAN